MADIVVNGNTSGAVTLSAPAVAGTVTVTLPSTTGTMLTTASSTGISGSAISSGTVAEAYGGTGTSTGYYGFKNRIINGAMVIDQRNAGASGNTSVYTVDRWQYIASQAAKGTWQQNAGSVTPPDGFKNYLGLTSSSAYSVLSSDYFTFRQSIEGFNAADLGFGTANASSITFSFWVRSSLTGTFGVCFENGLGGASARTFGATYTISTANTWEKKTITIAGDTSGTWASGNTTGLIVDFGLGVGSTYTLPSNNTWTGSATYLGATGATSVVGTNGATFYITGVQLEKGSTATSFDYRPYGTEFQLCQRYFEKSYLDGTAVGTFSASDTNSVRFDPPVTSQGIMVGINFAVRKRTAPTMTAYDAAFNAGKTSYFISSWNNNGTTGGWSTYQSGGTIAIAGITGAFAFSFAWIASSEL